MTALLVIHKKEEYLTTDDLSLEAEEGLCGQGTETDRVRVFPFVGKLFLLGRLVVASLS